jgi:hypothetical protein
LLICLADDALHAGAGRDGRRNFTAGPAMATQGQGANLLISE